jgi:hypothetical protein
MIDLRDRLEKAETSAAECQMIAELATDNTKRELYSRLALHSWDLATQIRKAIAMKDALAPATRSRRASCA